MAIRGITFDKQLVRAKDDGDLNAHILGDGIMSGCTCSVSADRLTIAPGRMICSGRVIRIDGSHVIDLNPTETSGYGQIIIEINLNGEASSSSFEQVKILQRYSATKSFPALTKQDINGSGQIYQMQLCLFEIKSGAASNIIEHPSKCEEYLPLTGGEMTGALNMKANIKLFNRSTVYGLPTPERANWAANKQYVDEQVNTRLPLTGGTITGKTIFKNNIGLNSPESTDTSIVWVPDPKNPDWVANKRYVDNQVNTRLPLTGGRMTGTLDMGGKKITGLPSPSDPSDAMTKGWADTLFVWNFNPIFKADANFSNFRGINVAAPVGDKDIANKAYVDSKVAAATNSTTKTWTPAVWGGPNYASAYTARAGKVVQYGPFCYVTLALVIPVNGWGLIAPNAELVIKAGSNSDLPAAGGGGTYVLSVGTRNVSSTQHLAAKISPGENIIRLNTYGGPLHRSEIASGAIFSCTISGIYPTI